MYHHPVRYDGSYIIDILEPHVPSRTDNLGKVRTWLSKPAVGRIQLIVQGIDSSGRCKFKRLDMTKGSVSNKVVHTINDEELTNIYEIDVETRDWHIEIRSGTYS